MYPRKEEFQAVAKVLVYKVCFRGWVKGLPRKKVHHVSYTTH
jgi:hypothetical protein